MKDYGIEYFIEEEKKGKIFAKIAKRSNDNNVHGGYFCYQDWIGKVLDCEDNHFKNGTTTIEPLEVALGYFHYGDQIVIINFEKLNNEMSKIEFAGYDNGKKQCYEVNAIFIQDILPMNRKTTIDYLMKNVAKEFWKDYSYKSAVQHLKERGEDNLTDYYVDSICKILNGEEDSMPQPESKDGDKNQLSFLKKFFSKH